MAIDEQALAREVEQWYRTTFEQPIVEKHAFVDAMSAVYAAPLHYLEPEEELMLGDAAAAKAFIQGFSDWRDEVPDSTAEVVRIQVRILNPIGAVLVADWRFNAPDGSALADSDPCSISTCCRRDPGRGA